MARVWYGSTPADFTMSPSGRVVAGVELTVWTARTGGTQVTDLLDADSAACTAVTSDASGGVRFQAPDGTDSTLWIDSGVGSRLAVRPVNLPTAGLSVGTVTTGTADATLTPDGDDAWTLDLVLPSAGANGVNTAAIQDDAVTAPKIAANAVGASELADNAVDTAAIADGAVTAAKLATTGRFTFPTGAANGYGFTSGASHLSGTGSPEGVVTAAPGSTWLQTDATTDVKGWIRWIKATGTGNTGWVAGPEADTGWRLVTTGLFNSWTGNIWFRRVGASVTVTFDLVCPATFAGKIAEAPSGFRNAAQYMYGMGRNGSTGDPLQLVALWYGSYDLNVGGMPTAPTSGQGVTGGVTYPTSDAWPASLPGVAA